MRTALQTSTGTIPTFLIADVRGYTRFTRERGDAANAPSGRYAMGMAYDAAGSQVALFGGFGGNYLADSWTWDGTDWTQRFPAHAASERSGIGMAYDAGRSQVVLFGGYDGGYLADTWTWDGADWGIPFRASLALYRSRDRPAPS